MTIIAEPTNTGDPTGDAIKWKHFLEALDTKVAEQTKKKPKSLANIWQIPADMGLKILIGIQESATRSKVRIAVHISEEPFDLMILP